MIRHPFLSPRQRARILSVCPALGRTRSRHDVFDILEAIHYLVTTGCQWGMLTAYYPPKSTVYHYFRKWSGMLHFDELLRKLVGMRRTALGQNPEPDGAVIDSQSVRLGLDDSAAGIDGGKKVKGVKRHIAVDRNGFPLAVEVSAANVHDSKGAIPVIVSVNCRAFSSQCEEHDDHCLGILYDPLLQVAIMSEYSSA